MRKAERDFDEFTKLKNEVFEKVTEQNAQQLFEDAKTQIMSKLQKLDVCNITEVEDLYLLSAQLTQTASYVAAIRKVKTKGTSFDIEIGNVGLDDIAPILLDAFKDHPLAFNLHKINKIDEIYKPSIEAWAALHARMELVANATKGYHVLNVLQDTVPTYKNYLENKLRKNKMSLPLPMPIPVNTPLIIKKLIIRYEAVLAIEARIKGKKSLNLNDMKFAQKQIKKCLDNRPDWTEKSFLKKLIDILSFGLKPLYRAFFSKENQLQKTLEQSIEPSKIFKNT